MLKESNVDNYPQASLQTLMLPLKMPKRGRLKGAATTVVDLPKKKARTELLKPVPFLKMTEQQ